MSAKAVLSAPLPRVYEETAGGKVVPLNASQGQGQVVLPIGGTDFNAEELAKISKETGKKLESEVLAPMERWMNAYSLVQVRLPWRRDGGWAAHMRCPPAEWAGAAWHAAPAAAACAVGCLATALTPRRRCCRPPPEPHEQAGVAAAGGGLAPANRGQAGQEGGRAGGEGV